MLVRMALAIEDDHAGFQIVTGAYVGRVESFGGYDGSKGAHALVSSGVECTR
ncbi:hypothetical protein NSPZN2_100110 [Nitrospira defluvii]|uniref:Uncharacterized protein n=1 Tax=Nitrospira defluvii TaxID=330214 RepID=A0ABM8R0A0_9BACT|nr:hypothetical protein NSPZN2_100110 [Nitrospira defluvii]